MAANANRIILRAFLARASSGAAQLLTASGNEIGQCIATPSNKKHMVRLTDSANLKLLKHVIGGH